MDKKQLARFISNIFAPPFLAVPIVLTICLSSTPTRSLGITWIVTTVMGICVIPVILTLLLLRLSYIKDFHITDRKQRPLILLGGTIIIALTIALLIKEHASQVVLLSFTSVFIGMITFTLITLRYKVSFHVGAATMAIIVMSLIYGPQWLYFSPLVLLIAWARLNLYAHTQWQMITGALVGGSIPLLVFTLSHY